MYLAVCEHPVRLKDNKTHKFMYVPCGKCPTCCNRRASTVVERLEQESQCHAFTLFFTLSYDEKNCPRLYYEQAFNRLFDPERETYVDLSEIKDFKPSSRLYVARRKAIPYVYWKDVQDFFKRLRYYVERVTHATGEKKTIRYYVVSEYGPSTYRPHYHGLLWFDSPTLGRCIHELICKSWTLGDVKQSFVSGKAERYVARYVSSVASLPKVYLHKSLRPKSVSSSCPAVGTLEVNSKEVREIFERGLVERVVHSQRTHKSKISPLWRTFENRLFPKIARFNEFNHNERVTLYSVYRLCPVDGFEAFIEWIKEQIMKPYRTWLADELISMYFADKNDNVYVNRYNRLKKLYYVSSRVYHQRVIFGVDLDYYVRKIEDYYNNKEQFKLRNFYGFQSDFARQYKTSVPLIYIYLYH